MALVEHAWSSEGRPSPLRWLIRDGAPGAWLTRAELAGGQERSFGG